MTEIKKSSLDNIHDIFKIPIIYNKNSKKLNDNIITDLELVNSIDKDEESIYDSVFNPSNKSSKQVIKQFTNYYTTDIDFLTDTQKLIKTLEIEEINTIRNKHNFNDFELNNIINSWEDIKNETGFCEKYLYIDFAFAKKLNNNSSFLQLMSIYNIASPILSLCLPIFVLIIPFFIIKLKGVELNIKQYIEILKSIISNHAIFKIFTQFHQVDNNQKIYLVISAAFYLFSIYQNMLVCIRFYSNMKKIHNYISQFKNYLAYTIDVLNYHSSKVFQLTTYNDFNIVNQTKLNTLMLLHDELNKITPFSFSFSKVSEIGHIMCVFYKIYDNEVYHNALLYSFGFNGYIDCIEGLKQNIQERKISFAKFTNKNKKIYLKNSYYAPLKDDNPIKNTIKFLKVLQEPYTTMFLSHE